MIGDDAQLVALAGKAQDGFQEVRAIDPVNPRCPHDHMLRQVATDRVLARQLAAAIDSEGRDGSLSR